MVSSRDTGLAPVCCEAASSASLSSPWGAIRNDKRACSYCKGMFEANTGRPREYTREYTQAELDAVRAKLDEVQKRRVCPELFEKWQAAKRRRAEEKTMRAATPLASSPSPMPIKMASVAEIEAWSRAFGFETDFEGDAMDVLDPDGEARAATEEAASVSLRALPLSLRAPYRANGPCHYGPLSSLGDSLL